MCGQLTHAAAAAVTTTVQATRPRKCSLCDCGRANDGDSGSCFPTRPAIVPASRNALCEGTPVRRRRAHALHAVEVSAWSQSPTAAAFARRCCAAWGQLLWRRHESPLYAYTFIQILCTYIVRETRALYTFKTLRLPSSYHRDMYHTHILTAYTDHPAVSIILYILVRVLLIYYIHIYVYMYIDELANKRRRHPSINNGFCTQ